MRNKLATRATRSAARAAGHERVTDRDTQQQMVEHSREEEEEGRAESSTRHVRSSPPVTEKNLKDDQRMMATDYAGDERTC